MGCFAPVACEELRVGCCSDLQSGGLHRTSQELMLSLLDAASYVAVAMNELSGLTHVEKGENGRVELQLPVTRGAAATNPL